MTFEDFLSRVEAEGLDYVLRNLDLEDWPEGEIRDLACKIQEPYILLSELIEEAL